MFFLLRMAFWLGLVLVLLPRDKTPEAEKLPQVGEVTHFNDALLSHCEQSARIVHDFCGEWYSKTEFQQGIDFENSSRFLAVAVQKLQAELQRQRGDT